MKLMVLDGNSIVNRAFYGVRPLTARDGTPTNAVYGFMNILLKLISDETPDALCVTFDLKAPTFRHESFEGYKAQRKAMPEDLVVQMPILKETLDAMNIPRYELSGFEADDLIGTIASKCSSAGWDCVIVTGDKDSFQLISDRTTVRHVKTRLGQTETTAYTPEVFFEEYGFTPEKMIDLKALMGDASDNIPGVPGVGEKTALELIRSYDTIAAIYENLDSLDIRESLKTKLLGGRESADMSLMLATICCDVPIAFSPADSMRRPVDNDKLYELFQRLGFTKLTERLALTPPGKAAAPKAAPAEIQVTTITGSASADAMFSLLERTEYCALRLDTELKQFAVQCANAVYYADSTDLAGFDSVLRRLLGSTVKKSGHNIKDTMRVLMEKEYPVDGWIFDTALASYMLEPTDSSYDLSLLTDRYCGYSMLGSADENGQMSMLSGQSDRDRLTSEARAVGALTELLRPKLTELGMDKLYYGTEIPLCQVLADMEYTGFHADMQALRDFSDLLSSRMALIEEEIYALVGEPFNINSPKQLGVILFEKLMLPAPKKTKTGWSTNIDILEKLTNKHPVVAMVIDYRQLSKLKSTYADGLVKVIAADGRIHTCFQMTVTATGRLSSTEPNLQNIPIRRELGGEIRKMFTAEAGNVLVDADYSQIELRILAHISNDETMKNAFLSGEDIHTVTASQVFGVPLDEVTSLQRSRAKAVNFGIVYGISQFSLSQDIGVSVAEAKFYMDSYLAKYHGVRDYMKKIVEQAHADGYVSTEFGRRRTLPELKSSNFNIRAFGERVALNTPIQGTAADVIKVAMVAVWRRLREEKLKAKLILQVHDELIVECPEEEKEKVALLLCQEMEGAARFSVPLTAEAGSGVSWYSAK